MSVNIPPALLAQADQKASKLKERLGYLMEACHAIADDPVAAGAWLASRLADEQRFTREDLAALLAVAVSMLAEHRAVSR